MKLLRYYFGDCFNCSKTGLSDSNAVDITWISPSSNICQVMTFPSGDSNVAFDVANYLQSSEVVVYVRLDRDV